MKHKRLFVALTAALVATGATAGQSDSGWYGSAGVGYVTTDDKRTADDAFAFGIGLGKYLSDRWSVELEYDQYQPDFDNMPGDFELSTLMLNNRLYLGDSEKWSPFLVGGLGMMRSDTPLTDSNNNLALQAGVGFVAELSRRWDLRSEVLYRYDTDDESIPGEDDFQDWVFKLGATVALGAISDGAPKGQAPTPDPKDSDGDGVYDNQDYCMDTPAGAKVDARGCEIKPEQPKPMKDNDHDNDGVVNADDKCPNTRAGATVDTDGCEVVSTIELPGVYFEFDSSALDMRSNNILDRAANILNNNQEIDVEVAGHTDSVGTDNYNQGLSERRANVVKDYLVNKGVKEARMTTRGYGESEPVADNSTDEGRAKNRRTELRVRDDQ